MNEETKSQLNGLAYRIGQLNFEINDWKWLEEQLGKVKMSSDHIYGTFSSLSRILPKKAVELLDADREALQLIAPGFQMRAWDTHRLARMLLLLNLRDLMEADYVQVLNHLFDYADISEMVALYSSLIVLEYPDHWKSVCVEGIRMNIGLVHEAIMYDNPYPFFYLDNAAWNQLILKAIFNDMQLAYIVGIYARMNEPLISALLDYVAEREAAGRTVSLPVRELLSLSEKNYSFNMN
ncbi:MULTISPECIES: EboA domain-containing protein [Olivibacter]|uniref:EboA domain-containing protein n=1 Tax=Olivibacter oleidegradans TaxID=760123 RepID=A0ABV6HTX3_9SPHI|nr:MULTISPECIES: EboA domain-containing protein [Olivibacter]MDM8174271.1 EboA domain-containing protein [Olivibacter sp. 47]QEL04095.1 hypothetical protein FKG96_25780 [Olivibacter sp. LS-1]